MDRTTKVFSVITLWVAAWPTRWGMGPGVCRHQKGLDTLITVGGPHCGSHNGRIGRRADLPESIKNYLVGEAGWRGLLIGMAGAITPVDPCHYPIARAISSAG